MLNLFTRSQHHKEPIYFFDTAKSELTEFAPLSPRRVTMYSCGPTVYDHIHIGNLRSFLLPDLIKRVLMYNGYHVLHTINVTDFGHLSGDGDTGEDKIMRGMKREGFPLSLPAMREFTDTYIASFTRDVARFGNLQPDHLTRASDYISEQISLVETLYQKGYAYETSDGLYFEIEKFPAYGRLGKLNVASLRAGARVEENPEKRHPADFALWKKAPLGWPSRFGTGFPGWHIECTAMAFATLGKQIDIHTGGEDLAYTHHNGEIAQAECATGKSYVQYWLHNAFITINDEKIAKSAGNGITLETLIERGFDPLTYRFWLLQSHYRTTANWSEDALAAARTAHTKLKRFVYEELGDQPLAAPDEAYEQRFATIINRDLDTPSAVALLFELIKDEAVLPASKLATIHVIDSVLGIGLSLEAGAGKAALGFISPSDIPPEISAIISERDLARTTQNWTESDRLRELLKLKGYSVEDTKDGTRVTKE